MTVALVAPGGVVLQESMLRLVFHSYVPLILAVIVGRVPQEVCYYLSSGPALSLVSSQGVGS